MSDLSRQAARWQAPKRAAGNPAPGPHAEPEPAIEGARVQRSVRLPEPAAAMLRDAALSTGCSQGDIIATAHARHGAAVVVSARAKRRQTTFWLPQRVVDEIDMSAAAAGCTRGDYVDALLQAYLPDS